MLNAMATTKMIDGHSRQKFFDAPSAVAHTGLQHAGQDENDPFHD